MDFLTQIAHIPAASFSQRHIQIRKDVHLLGLDSKLSLREVSLSLLLLLGHSSGILWRKTSSDSTGLLCSEIEWQVFLALVENPQLVSLVGVDDCEGSGDRLSQIMSAQES